MKQAAMAASALIVMSITGAALAQTTSCDGEVHNCFLLRVPQADYSAILSSHALEFHADVLTGDPRLVLVTGPANILPETTLANVQAEPAVLTFEMVSNEALTEGGAGAGVDTAAPELVGTLASTGLHTGPESAHFAGGLWNGYMNQPATSIMKLSEAHADPRPEALGLGVVAVIDTGVDPDHPLLEGALVPGYDFILEQAGFASEWSALDPAVHASTQQDLQAVADQSYAAVVDGTSDAFVEQSYAAVVDQSYAAVVDQSYAAVVDSKDLPPGFGHGTMVAGLVRLVAPAAKIMPVRVFDEMGAGNLGDIVRAIYFAVDNGADVINMSFSTATYSAELQQAVTYARQAGVVCVSSAGNEGQPGLKYPSAFGQVIGVASTDHDDKISDFSNYGLGLVFLGGTGEALITAFPGGLYAAAWGTSFSSAIVSGTVALLHKDTAGGYDAVNYFQAALALTQSAKFMNPFKLGAGRLDINHAMNCGLSGGAC